MNIDPSSMSVPVVPQTAAATQVDMGTKLEKPSLVYNRYASLNVDSLRDHEGFNITH